MKNTFLSIALFFLTTTSFAQSTGDIIKQQAGEGVKDGANIATQTAADKLLGKIFSKKNKKDKSGANTSGNSKDTGKDTTGTSLSASQNGNNTNALQVYSHYDFIPGAKVMVYEDFSHDAIGDYPANWNTNSSGETVTVSGQEGHWLMLNKRGLYLQEDVKSLPDNFTYEYDMIYTGDDYAPELQLFLVNSDNIKMNPDIGQRSGIIIGIQRIPRNKGGMLQIFSYDNGKTIINNHLSFENNGDEKMKISIWRQQQRMRVYINQDKILDLPHAFAPGHAYNTVMFKLWGDAPGQDKYMLSNLKLAVGDPDTRNKIITVGKFSTTGILFDVNSATIKPESYGTLKDIATVLQENSNVKVKIIGHTDSDGDAAANLTLSQKRAESVKSILVNEFKIDAARLETDGKGASQPIASNANSEGKAQNRRVEFIKL